MADTLPPIVATLLADIKEFTAKMDEAKAKVAETSKESSAELDAMSKVGKAALFGVAGGAVAAAAASVDLGMKFQEATTTLAANAGISVKAATNIGDAMQATAGKSIFSATALTTSFASVAAELGSTEGKAYTAAQALSFMKTSSDLAEGSGISLQSATESLGQVMQSYGIKAKGAASASDILFQSARLSGNSVPSVTAAVQRLHTQLGITTPPLGQTGALLVDMAKHGATGSVAIRTLSTAMTSLLKPMVNVQTSTQALNQATAQLPPGLQALAQAYQRGQVTATEVTKATAGLNVQQKEAWTNFTTAAAAVDKAKTSYADLGLTVTDANGKFVGIKSVIEQLQPKLVGMTQAQQLATLTQVFGAKAAKELLTTITAGPAAYGAATAAVQRQNAVHEAAVKQQATLQHQIATIEAELEDYGIKIGVFLIPKIEDLIHVTGSIVGWFDKHRAAAVALGTIIAGFLTVAIKAFVTEMDGPVVTALKTAAQQFGLIGTDATEAEGKVSGAAAGMESDAAAIQSAATAIGTKFSAAAGVVGEAMTSMETSVGTAVAAITADLAALQAEIAETLGDLDALREGGAEPIVVDVVGEGGAAGDAGAAGTDEAAGSTEEAATSLDAAAEALDTSAEALSSAAEALKVAAADSEATDETASELDAGDSEDLSGSSADLAGASEDLAVAAAKLAVGGGGVVPGKGGEGEGEAAGAGAVEEDAIGEGIAASFLKGNLTLGIGGLIGVQLYNALLEKPLGKKIGTDAASTLGDAATGGAIGLAIAGPFGAAAGTILGTAFAQRSGIDKVVKALSKPNPNAAPGASNDIVAGKAGGLHITSTVPAPTAQQVAITAEHVQLAKSADLAKQQTVLDQLKANAFELSAEYGKNSPQALAAVKALQTTEGEWMPKLQTEAGGLAHTNSVIAGLTANESKNEAKLADLKSQLTTLHGDLKTQEGVLNAAKATLAQDKSVGASTSAINAAKEKVSDAEGAVNNLKGFISQTSDSVKGVSKKAEDDARQLKLETDVQKVETQAAKLVQSINAGIDVSKLPPQETRFSGQIRLVLG
jgi:uncharacterized membrane-anchored protein YhcB (DUF1043 family)